MNLSSRGSSQNPIWGIVPHVFFPEGVRIATSIGCKKTRPQRQMIGTGCVSFYAQGA